MGAESPNVILYDVNGQEMSVSDSAAIPAGTSALMIAGSDGTNSHFITLDGYGRTVTVGAGTAGTPVGGIVTVQGVTNGTTVPITFGDPGTEDIFANVITAHRNRQIQILFFKAAPSTLLTVTTSGSGATAQGTGVGTFSSGTTASSEAKGVSVLTTQYFPHSEIYAAFTASFTTGITTSFQRLGIYNATDGFSFGYSNATFGLWSRFNTTDTFVAQASWNVDTLSGASNSKFTQNGVPVSFVPTNINLFRIRFGWLGIANVIYEVLAPDGNFVIVHTIKSANSQTTPTLTSPNLPLTCDVSNTTGGTNLIVTCGCWVAGNTGNQITQPYYGPSGQSMTITLTSLASAAARASNVVNNTYPIYEDALLFFKIKTGSTGTLANGYINVYGYGSVDNGTTYPEGITGTDATVTLTVPPNLVLIAQINTVANATTYTFGPISFCRMYGIDRLPALWGVVIVNQSGHALDTSAGGTVTYQGVNGLLG